MSLDADDIATIKGMLLRGDDLHHIAAYFGENSGRVAEIKAGMPEFAGQAKRKTNGRRVVRGQDIAPTVPDLLPPPGPYYLNFRQGKDIILDGLECSVEAIAHYVATNPGEHARDMQRRFHSAIAERKRELWKGRQK